MVRAYSIVDTLALKGSYAGDLGPIYRRHRYMVSWGNPISLRSCAEDRISTRQLLEDSQPCTANTWKPSSCLSVLHGVYIYMYIDYIYIYIYILSHVPLIRPVPRSTNNVPGGPGSLFCLTNPWCLCRLLSVGGSADPNTFFSICSWEFRVLAFGLWIYSSRLQAVRALWFRATSRLESRAVGLQDLRVYWP